MKPHIIKFSSIFSLSLILLGSCSGVERNTSSVALKDQGVSMNIPDGWTFDGDMLMDENNIKKGEFTLGVVEPNPYIDCEEFMNRSLNGGEDMETDKGGYGFIKGEGGDVILSNEEVSSITLDDKEIYRIKSDMISYGEDGQSKGVRCGYCLQLSNKKLGLFAFYLESDSEIAKADTIISSMELLK